MYLEIGPAQGVSSVHCSNSTVSCPTGNTCCLLSDGKSFGCCPQDEGVCCSDHVHCCPKDYTCDLSNGKCVQTDAVPRPLTKPLSAVSGPRDVICPEKRVQCQSGNTCCKTGSGEYGCCPIEDAVCCADQRHCCPKGYTCDPAHNTCIKSGALLPMLGLHSQTPDSQSASPADVVCKDDTQCPNANTCCKVTDKFYACCGYAQATCCPDGIYCCPHGYTCEPGSNHCTLPGNSLHFLEKRHLDKPKDTENVPTISKPREVTCANGMSKCGDSQTCCQLEDEEYGCCLVANAVCCSDHTHCCPAGSTCGSGACVERGIATPLLEKVAAAVDLVTRSRQDCADGDVCPDDQTCCMLQSGISACCPSKNATCCPDHKHCCPHGLVCNSTSGTCDGRSGQVVAHLLLSPSAPVDEDFL